ncbi:MAG TPA: hypothetical protein PLM29_12010 [Deltaproteobacteria bacterium]|nr:hypothetical protein [Deltaproteobacteria bacterium]
MRSERENAHICSMEESLCIITAQDSHVCFSIHEFCHPCRLIEPVVSRAGSLEIMTGFNIPEYCSAGLIAEKKIN